MSTIAALVEEAKRLIDLAESDEIEKADEALYQMPVLVEDLAALLADMLPVVRAAAEQARTPRGWTPEGWCIKAAKLTADEIRRFLAAHPGALDEPAPPAETNATNKETP